MKEKKATASRETTDQRDAAERRAELAKRQAEAQRAVTDYFGRLTQKELLAKKAKRDVKASRSLTNATPPAAPRRSRQEILAEIQQLVQQLAESMEERQA